MAAPAGAGLTPAGSPGESSWALLSNPMDSAALGSVDWIPARPEHWAIESYVPLEYAQIRRRFEAACRIDARSQTESLAKHCRSQWHHFEPAVGRVLDAWSGRQLRRTGDAYGGVDPDADPIPVDLLQTDDELDTEIDPDTEYAGRSDQSDGTEHAYGTDQASELDGGDRDERIRRIFDEFEALATAAGYTRITRDQIQQCVGVASAWGVPLKVDFDAIERLSVFARGDIVARRSFRHWRTMYRRRTCDVEIYGRMAVAFIVKPDANWQPPSSVDTPDDERPQIHLRLFKNIPKQDVDMLLPTARVRISAMDSAKIILPSLGGFLLSLRKVAQFTLLLAALALHWTFILVGLLISYAIKSIFSYLKTRDRYQLSLTRNLYFQKLDTNAGVLSSLIQQAARQRRREAALAYHAIAVDDEPISTRRIKRRAERYIREAVGIEVNFRIDRAITLLVDANLVERENNRWRIIADDANIKPTPK